MPRLQLKGVNLSPRRDTFEPIEIASRDEIGALQLKRLKSTPSATLDGTPVIDMDTLIAPLDKINVHSFLAPDNEFMGAAVTQALVEDQFRGHAGIRARKNRRERLLERRQPHAKIRILTRAQGVPTGKTRLQFMQAAPGLPPVGPRRWWPGGAGGELAPARR